MNRLQADRQRRAGAPLVAVAILPLAVVAGCSTSAPAPEQMARSTVETAPADLQLLCADAAAKASGAAGGTVLPVSSRRADATTYQVELNVAGSTSTCIVDDAGNVVSLQPGAT